jgi:uncharacterized protein YjiS (DUF1127 family)
MLCRQAPGAATRVFDITQTKAMIMSTQSAKGYLSFVPTVASGPQASGKLQWWLKSVERICTQIHRRRELRDLVALNDRLLADIGITREQADAARKAYWL